MNHQERMELLAALAQLGVSHYKSHDLEINFSASPKVLAQNPLPSPIAQAPQTPPLPQTQEDAEKLKSMMNTLSMGPEELLDQIFPAGAGG